MSHSPLYVYSNESRTKPQAYPACGLAGSTRDVRLVSPGQARRMKAHAKALARRGDGCYGDTGCPKRWKGMNHHVWMPTARLWRMPVAEVKRIVKGKADA